jgi:hypothetical protein
MKKTEKDMILVKDQKEKKDDKRKADTDCANREFEMSL